MNRTANGRVLVLGDDMRIFLGVVRSLGRAGIKVHVAPFDWYSPALKSRYIFAQHRLPRYSDDPASWLRSLLETLDANAIDLVVPTCDRAILPLHHHRNELSAWRMAIPSSPEMDLLFDKECTRDLCAQLGIPIVGGSRVAIDDTAARLISRFNLPLVIKPRKSYWMDRLASWGKVSIVDSKVELEEVLNSINERSRYLVEGYFEGSGVGVSVLANEGQILQAFQHRRLREGLGGSSSYRISEPVNTDLLSACAKICGYTRMTGVCMFEFRFNLKSQEWVLLETNARFWGSLPLPLSLGVDFPRFLYDLLVHQRVHASVSYPAGVRSRNLVLDGYNLMGRAGELRSVGFSKWVGDVGDFLLQPVRWLSGRERSDSFVLDDPKPGLWECAGLFKYVPQKLSQIRCPCSKLRCVENG